MHLTTIFKRDLKKDGIVCSSVVWKTKSRKKQVRGYSENVNSKMAGEAGTAKPPL